MTSVVKVLTIGSSPTLRFCAWRLQASQSCQIYACISLDSRPLQSDPNLHMNFSSDRYGQSCVYTPDFVCDDLSTIDASFQFDAVFLSLENLKQLSKIPKLLSPLIESNTAIFFDVSKGIPPLDSLVDSTLSKLTGNLGYFLCDEYVVQTSVSGYSHVSSNNQIFLTQPGKSTPVTRNVVFALQSAGCNAVEANAVQFKIRQWQQAIAAISMQFLSICLDVPDLTVLINDVLAKPVYKGLMNELYYIAKTNIDDEQASAKLLPLPSSMTNNFSTWVPVIPGLNQSTSYMYYLFYKQFPIATEVHLLPAILLADDLKVRTPYLEYLFAQLTSIMSVNKDKGILFQRKNILREHDSELAYREQMVARREEEVARREHSLGKREHAMKSAHNSPPTPVLNHMPSQQFVPKPNGRKPPLSRPSSTSFPPQTPATPSIPPENIDMMSITQRKSRRSFIKSQSTNSLSQSFDFYHQQKQPNNTSRRLSLSQSFGQYDPSALHETDRYGNVSSVTNLSHSMASRCGSLINGNGASPPAVAPQLDPSTNGYANGYRNGTSTRPNSNGNMLEPGNNHSSLSSSPSTPPSFGSDIQYRPVAEVE